MTASARLAASLLMGGLALGGAATATPTRSGNPSGRWATPEAVRAIILSLAGDSRINVGGWGEDVVVKVLSATVAGIPPSRLINGVPRFQLFEVRACTIYYFRGAHRYRAHFRWFTRRPAGGTITTGTRDGRIAVVRDNGAPYYRDWNHALSIPQAYGHC